MPGAPEVAYVRARRVLLDALAALEAHRSSIILVGAQAVYIHTGEANLAVAPYTTDADLAIDVAALAAAPLLEAAMSAAGFRAGEQPGAWIGDAGVPIDLMVAEAQGGSGSRAARIPPHGKRVARKALGLEGALVDREARTIAALGEADPREFEILVAGPGALLLSKLIKIEERRGNPRRESDKDALDVLRLLRAVETQDLAARLDRIRTDPRSGPAAAPLPELLSSLFGSTGSPGCEMAVRATEALEDPDEISASCSALAGDLISALGRTRGV